MARTRNQPPPTLHSLLILLQSQISSPTGSGPRYAPVDPTLPEPWKGLVDVSTGYLYYWNPVTNKTQYEKPVKEKLPGPPPPPAKPASLSVSSSVLRGEAHDEDGRSRSHQAHPGAIQYRHKAVPSFENLQIIYGKDRATGLGAETIKERHVRLEMKKEVSDSINTDQEGDKEIDQEDDIKSVAPSSHQEQVPKASSSKVTYKRKYGASNHNISEEFHMLKTGMDSVAAAILSCAPRVYTEEEIFEEVSKVEGLDEDSQLLAYNYLCEDAVRGRTFIGLPIKRRKRWLELKLGRG